jgi:adhesin transport system outer membrane protein
LALKNNPTIKSSKADLEARNKQKETAKSQLYPSFDIAFDYNWKYDMDYTNPGKEEYYTAMALVSFNIFNGGWNKARIGQTTYEINEAEEISRNSMKQTVQSVRLSWESSKTAAERVVYLEDYVKSAGLTADAFTSQWNIGRRTMFDLLDTQQEYINSQVMLLNAKYDKLYSEYRILSGMGKLIPTLGLPLPEQSLVTAAE